MSQWSEAWRPGIDADDRFDLLEALDQESNSYAAPNLGEETSFSDAALSAAAYTVSERFNSSHGLMSSLEYNHHSIQCGKDELVDDTFMTLPNFTETDNDWFINSIFGDQDLVYNDKNLGEAATQPCIKSEHSYSSNNLYPVSPLPVTKTEEIDMAALQSTSNTDLNLGAQLIQAAATASTQPQILKSECPANDPLLTAMTSTATSTPLARPATIILATSSTSSTPGYSHSAPTVFPAAALHIKAEPMETLETFQEQTVMMPPTPPSSNGSDSDGSQSPQRSAPNSPLRQSPMPQSGLLILSEEEKRTLISEGYPVPSKLPLTKQEEKNLKKVRRKIKNKISAQESRRKKKEYVEALEKRVEAINHENSDLKKKLATVENDNRSLMGELRKLQAMISKMPKSAVAAASAQTGTVLMVLVLCFAVFLGGTGSGSSSLNVGYSPVAKTYLAFQQPGPLRPQPDMGPGPARAADTADDYTTPNLKSRVLMAFSREDADDCYEEYGPLVPSQSCPTDMEPGSSFPHGNGPADPGVENVLPVVSKAMQAENTQQSMAVVTIAVGTKENVTESAEEYQAMMHPDIAVAPTLPHRGNFSADLETA